MRGGEPFEKLAEKAKRSGKCMEWAGTIAVSGYGVLQYKGRQWKAHRLAWFARYGAIPQGMLICHHCDNRKCIRIDHLFLGTHDDNMQDKTRKGRQSRWETAGRTKLTGDQVRLIRKSPLSSLKLAPLLGVSSVAIRLIRRGINWKGFV